MNAKNVAAVIFDLGNVLIRLQPQKTFETWARYSMVSRETLEARFELGEWHDRLETGTCGIPAFHQHMNGLMGVKLTLEQFAEGWNAILGPEVEEVGVLARTIKKRSTTTKLALLTNTNELHETVWRSKLQKTLSLFDGIFASHRIGYKKPDPNSYQRVLEGLDVAAETCLFFDDLEENIAAARGLGIRSELVTGPEVIKTALQSTELI